ncbi:DUF1742-domain-containing protein [Athelia psychrophila]|uniref:DUF1742-domain-containing protein n=1 Tax=Athelia psychrophila TaxID=1759441 RepID=A0A166AXX9_9AGAM|nr:DUF1742-domain-containing protein [Fibularhizoctonia sp. CBS 109695]
MSFTNLYYKRATGTPKACFVCYKPSNTVLATINTTDFLYTCDTHLTDPGFATLVNDGEDAKKPVMDADEIARVKREWEEQQKRKAEKEAAAKEKAKAEEAKDAKDTDGEAKPAKKTVTLPGTWTPPPAPTPTHQKYTLHRDMFSLRQSEHRRRRQTAQAKSLAPRLPGAPRGDLA